jgi:hypothetical protein
MLHVFKKRYPQVKVATLGGELEIEMVFPA